MKLRIQSKKDRPSMRSQKGGFTLAEMMVVIVIIGLLATLVVPNVLQKFAFASRKKAEADLVAIKNALTEYAVANGGKFPDSLEVLVTPDVNGHTYLDTTKIPKDPWGREYMYEAPGPGQPQPRVYSYGKDGQQGGEGDDADIDNLTIGEGK
jgi:general secretion pathway protein G